MGETRATGPGRPRLGLVLGAGGARGFAHVGALRVIERAGLPVDLVVGVSIGSLIGAAYAAGLSPAAMVEAARAVRFARLFRPRPSRAALVDPAGVRDAVRRLLGDRRFADLDRELAIVTASLSTGRAIAIRDGPVADAVVASLAIPLLFPPVALGADRFVDGGMIDGLPVRVARELGADVVVALDADNHARPVLRPPGLGRLARRLAGALAARAPVGPDAALILSRLLDHVAERADSETPDLLIRPRFGRLTSFHYHHWERCVELGERAAGDALADLLALGDRVATRPS